MNETKRTNYHYPVALLDRLKEAKKVNRLSVVQQILLAIEAYLKKIGF